jgi:hypothetical protein
MPDQRKHRGPHPEDVRLFDAETHPLLRAAAGDLCWLLNHGYPHDSTLKLVGDRYRLVARQRTAVSRCCCSDADVARRQSRQITAEQLAGAVLWLDGYNVLTTVEAALAGGLILATRDGVCRDMASMHGSYRKVAETLPALELLGQTIASLDAAECRWLLDQPVSNSGRLKGLIEQMALAHGWRWVAELTPNPDNVLANPTATNGVAVERRPQRNPAAGASQSGIVVATADSAILDRCPAWFNLAKETIDKYVSDAWVVQLTHPPPQVDVARGLC